MFRKTVVVAMAIAALSLASVHGTFAKDGNRGGNKGQTQTEHSGMDGHHDDIESGRDFGQHVSEMNDKFSGDHNPGKHHQGYSGIKD